MSFMGYLNYFSKNNHNEQSASDYVKMTTNKSSRKTNSYRLFLRRRRRNRHRKCIRHFLRQFHSRTKSATSHYKTHNHVIIVRASENSTACQHLQIILNQSTSSLDQLIDSQFLLTSQNNYQSVCILFDDHKQSEQHRSSFLQYVYQSLSNTLKSTLQNRCIQITCMNLVFFNNSICDLTRMHRIRLIDTGDEFKSIFFFSSSYIQVNKYSFDHHVKYHYKRQTTLTSSSIVLVCRCHLLIAYSSLTSTMSDHLCLVHFSSYI